VFVILHLITNGVMMTKWMFWMICKMRSKGGINNLMVFITLFKRLALAPVAYVEQYHTNIVSCICLNTHFALTQYLFL
jgi:hypothetical protein